MNIHDMVRQLRFDNSSSPEVEVLDNSPTKRICIFDTVAHRKRFMTITPTTRVCDLMREMNLDDVKYCLMDEANGTVFKRDSTVFNKVEPDGVLYAIENAHAGGLEEFSIPFRGTVDVVGMFERVKPVPIPIMRNITPAVIKREKVVDRPDAPLWKQLGWTKDGDVLSGQYRTEYASPDGRILLYPSKRITVQIWNPPRELRGHPQWVCFTREGLFGGLYRVHLHGPGENDVASGIMVMRKIIIESFTTYAN